VPTTKASLGAKQTLLGVAPPSNRTGPEPQPYAPAPIDRAAETREAAPAPNPQAPRYDTVPIPLVPITASNDSVEPYVPPSSKNETFGAHTTDARRSKTPWAGVMIAVVVLALLGGGIAIAWKTHATTTVATSPTPTPTPIPTPTPTLDPIPTPVASPTPTPSVAPSATTALPVTTAKPSVAPTAKPSAAASSSAHRPGSGL